MGSTFRSRPAAVAGPSGPRRARRTRPSRRAWLATSLSGLLALGVVGVRPGLAVGESSPPAAPQLEVASELEAEADAEGTAGVIVQLAAADALEPEAVVARGEQLVAELEDDTDDETGVGSETVADDDVTAAEVLPHLGVVALEASPEALDDLSRSDLVERIEPDDWLRPALDRSAAQVGAPAAWAAGFTGAGSVVAVVDSGIDSTHPALAGKIVQEACFSDRSCPGGLSLAGGPGAAAPCTIGGPCQHGTHVAGIVAGIDRTYRGIAPDAGIMALQVFSRSDDPAECGAVTPCPRARTSDVLAALDHVFAQKATVPVVAVNMSLSSDSASAACDASILAGAVNRLRSVGVATVVATGNSGSTAGLGLPACITSTVSVAATYPDRDEVWAGSNVSPDLDLLAPGVGIMSPNPGGTFTPTTGTSAAAPHVAGAWALAVQRLGTSDVDTVLAYLQANGRPVAYAGLTKPRLDVSSLAGGLPTASAGFRAVATNDNPCAACVGVSGDFDGDGRVDLFWHHQGGTSRLWTSLGDGRYREDLAVPVGPTRFVPVAGDFDGDGRSDLMWYPSDGGDAWVWWSLGGGSFRPARSFATQAGWQPVAGDFDGNGLDDVFFYGPAKRRSTIFRAQAGGTFVSDQAWKVGPGYRPVAGDFTGDGLTDLFWHGPGAVADWLWAATGSGAFANQVAFTVNGDVAPTVGDFNGDGRSDILWVAPGGATSLMWRAGDQGAFQTEELVLPGEGRDPAVAGDHDGDGRADLYWYGAGSRADRLWLSR